MDNDLPFFYWTLNERYSEDVYPSFEDVPDFNEDDCNERNHPLHLHRLRLNQREDSSIFDRAKLLLLPNYPSAIPSAWK